MSPKFSFLVLFFTIMTNVLAQNGQITITGKVIDSATNEPLINCNVAIMDTKFGSVTDGSGFFTTSMNTKKCTLIISYVGYETVIKPIFLDENKFKIHLLINMDPKVLVEEEVKVIAEKNIPSTILQNVEPKDIQLMPNIYSDVLRSVQILAGVATKSELSSGYHVRGGTYDENLIYLNGYEIYRPFLLRTGYEESQTTINPDMVNDLTFYNGAFPAQYGDRMSSALEVNYSREQKSDLHGSIHADLLNMGLNLKNKIGRLNWNLGLRYAYPTFFLGGLQTRGNYNPRFSDIQLLTNYNFSKKSSLEFLGIYSENKIEITPKQWDGVFGFQTRGDYRGVTLEYSGQRNYSQRTHLIGVRFNNNFGDENSFNISFAKYAIKEKEDYNLSSDIFYSPNAYSPYDDREYLKTRYENGNNSINLDSYRIRAELELKHEIHNFNFGAEYRIENIDNILDENLFEIGDSSLNQKPILDIYNNSYQLNSLSLFMQDNLVFSSKLEMNVGIRFLRNKYSNENLLSPRVILFYRPSILHSISLSWGYYYQPPFLNELRSTKISSLKSQRAIHYVLGWEYYFKENVKFKAEVYYKDLDNLIPFYYDVFKMTYTESNNREGYAYGMDLMIEGEIVEGMKSWFGYSYLDTRERKLGENYQRRLVDQTHTIQIFLQDRMPKLPNWQSHLRFLVGSGFLNYPRIVVTDERTGNSYLEVSSKNPFEYLYYLRVDMGLSTTFDVGEDKKLIAVVEVLNLFDHYNIGAYEWVQVFKNIKAPFQVPHILSKRFFNLKLEFRF
jgi:CarboxypepD_reg-like domain